jgi:transcriptional regulator with PAS, ATPase and Fis domain
VGGKLRGSVAVIRDLTEINRLLNELDQAKAIIRNLEAKYTFDDIRGKSPIIQNAIEKARMAAATPATVILRGESGTGKELFAHAIHNASNRKYNRFIRVNCAAIAESLLESELFGYEEGAFTGASKGGKQGLFEQANGGTLFLDEIGEVNMSTQAKLLRVLQEKEITRVGGSTTIPVDVRILSATNLDLERAVKEGAFRQDLYYRLNVVPISIPPLRERKEDLDELLGYLVSKYNQEYGRSVESISPKAMLMIRAYDWPGNIRELENFIGRTMINMKMAETVVRPEHLPNLEEMKQTKEQVLLEAYDGLLPSLSLKSVTDHVEKTHIERVLALNEGNREQTARDLGISLRSLYYKMKKNHISD